MHEWLSGGVSPCQGEGRGFESRLVLFEKPDKYQALFFFCVVFYVVSLKSLPLRHDLHSAFGISISETVL